MTPRGFTLVEIMVVLFIVAVVLAVSVPAYQNYIDRARVLEAVSMVDATSRRIRDRVMTTGKLPDTLDQLAIDTGITVPLDPWGRSYEYFNRVTSTGNGIARTDKNAVPLNSDFELYSRGPDGLTAASLGDPTSRDDIVRARNGRQVGTGEDVAP